MEAKLRTILKFVGASAAAAALMLVNGCGHSSGANVVKVTVSTSVNPVILGQSASLTATVTGNTNTAVNWQPCQWTKTTVSGTTTTTSKPANCPSDGTLGTLSNELSTGTATYVAPTQVPDPTTYPNLVIIITAQSQADTTQTGSVNLSLNSGISVVMTPATATVPTKEQQLFSVALTNDLKTKGVTWLITQGTPTSTIPYPSLTSCSPTCGTITPDTNANTAIYQAPDTVPTTATLAIVATSNADTTRYTVGTITIILGGPIAFNNISPTIAPQGAAYWDIYLNAPNISSVSKIMVTDSNNVTKTYSSITGQVKVLFPIPTSTTTTPASTGARLRLIAADLASAGTYTVTVSDPGGQPVTTCSNSTCVYKYTVLPVRPSVTASVPDDVLQGSLISNTALTIDGGYFGPNGQLAIATFEGNTLSHSSSLASDSRYLNLVLPNSDINSGLPGLYPLSVSRTTPPLPTPNNPAVTNLAVFPDYSSVSPQIAGSIGAGTSPSAIDIDPVLGVAVVAETGSNTIEFFSIGQGTLTSIGTVGNTAAAPIVVPTGVAVNRANHTVAVVNYGAVGDGSDQSVTVLPIPGAPVQAPGTPFSVSLATSKLFGSLSPAPVPYAIGVDPDTNIALVAYSSTSTLSAANLGFTVNLDTTQNLTYGCLGDTSAHKLQHPCVFAQVTLNNGAYPQIAMAPHGHLAFVTPGGSGIVRGVDVTQPSSSATISGLSIAAGIVTVTTSTDNGLTPGNAGTVLIQGVPTTNNLGNTNFNGVFVVSVSASNTFSYALNSTASGSLTSPSGTVYYGSPNLNYGGLSQTTQGIAINPITRTAALADANATGQNGPQINLLNALDQSTSSISYFANCTGYTTNCANSAELPGTTSVAWQPYTNAVVSLNSNASTSLVSVADPVSRKRYAITPLPGTVAKTISVPSGANGQLLLSGGLAVDAATNQAFVVESGSNNIQIVNLGNLGALNFNAIKSAQITELVVPSPTATLGSIGGIPNATVPQATLTSTSDLAGVQIYGSGFSAGAQVRLDGTAIPSGNVQVVGSRQMTVKIPASFLAMPHLYALDVISNGVQSNATDFLVIKSIDLSGACTGTNSQPTGVAIADQLANGAFSPIAAVTNSGCNSVSIIDINPASASFGTARTPVSVGKTPQGIAISQRYGYAVVANNGDGTASILDLTKNPPAPLVAAVATGSTPAGVAVNETTATAIVANTGSNTISEINVGLLFGSSPPTTLTASSIGGVEEPLAVAIDPDRGTNNQGVAIVTGLELVSGSAPFGALFVVDIGLASPSLSTTATTGSVTASPTGIVFDPIAPTGTANLGLFYANSSGSNVISTFNPDSGGVSSVSVGINPTSFAYNPQTGALLTANVASKTVSVVDMLSSPYRTRQTIGLPGSPAFGVAIDQFTNLAVIADQANNRVLLFPMPK